MNTTAYLVVRFRFPPQGRIAFGVFSEPAPSFEGRGIFQTCCPDFTGEGADYGAAREDCLARLAQFYPELAQQLRAAPRGVMFCVEEWR